MAATRSSRSARHAGDLLLELVGLFLGAQIHRAHGLALVHQPFEAMLGLLHLRQLVERLDLGQRQHAVGLAAQALDDALDHALAIARRLLDLALAAHAAFARASTARASACFSALSASPSRVSPTARRSAACWRLCSALAISLAQRHALGLDLGGLGGKLGDRRRDLLAPRIELDDLALGIGQAVAPAGMVLRDLAEALDPHGDLAGQAIAVAFGLDQRRPQLGDARPQRARGDAVGLGVGDRRQARLAEGAAHLGVGDVAHDLGRRLLDAAEPRAQLIGAARHVGVPVARLGRGALGGGDGVLRRALGGAGRFARILRLAPRRVGHRALVRARLLDARSSRHRGPRPAQPASASTRAWAVSLFGRRPRRSAGGSRPAGCAGSAAPPPSTARRRAWCSRPSATPRRRA